MTNPPGNASSRSWVLATIAPRTQRPPTPSPSCPWPSPERGLDQGGPLIPTPSPHPLLHSWLCLLWRNPLPCPHLQFLLPLPRYLSPLPLFPFLSLLSPKLFLFPRWWFRRSVASTAESVERRRKRVSRPSSTAKTAPLSVSVLGSWSRPWTILTWTFSSCSQFIPAVWNTPLTWPGVSF